ncbi:MAG: EF-hand domain-containing protein [Gallionellaceae bacterium]|nr:EF-hand domain-containing protein [Gallionellaceae bacterium]
MSTVSGVSNARDAAMPQAAKPISPQQKVANLFQQIDTEGSGRISKSQFTKAFSTLNTPASVKALGAEAVFSKLDPSGTGTVTKQDFIKGMEAVLAQASAKEIAAKTPAVPQAQAKAVTPSLPPVPTSNVASVGSGPIGNTINVSA